MDNSLIDIYIESEEKIKSHLISLIPFYVTNEIIESIYNYMIQIKYISVNKKGLFIRKELNEFEIKRLINVFS